MVTKRFLSIFLLAVTTSMMGFAKIYDKLILKDGSIVEGYILSQRPGKTVSFHSEKTLFCIPMKAVADVVNHELEIKCLPQEWQDWVKDNPAAVKEKKGKRYLLLSDISFIDTDASDSTLQDTLETTLMVNNVRVVEKGDNLKYLALNQYDKTYNLAEIQKILKTVRDKDVITGLKDIISLRNGKSHEGQIIEQVVGKSIRILSDDGVMSVVNNEDILSQEKKIVNPDQDIFQQTPFLDAVLTLNGEKQGIVVYQNYGSKNKAPYLFILDKNKRENRVDIKDIVEMRRIHNEQYEPVKSLNIAANEVYLNQKIVNMIDCDYDEKNSFFYIEDTLSNHFVLFFNSIHGKLVVETENTSLARSAILLPVKRRVTKKDSRYVFSYEDIVSKRLIAPKTYTTKDNRILHTEYDVYPDFYVLFYPNTRNVIFFEIK